VTSADPNRPKTEPAQQPLHDVIADTTGEHEPITITDVHGSVARFEMSYSPPNGASTSRAVRFAAPWRQRIPSLLFLALALACGGVVMSAYGNPNANGLYTWIVLNDRFRPMPSQALAVVLLVCAVATVLRAQMRGVMVNPDWIQTRYLLPLGIPASKRWGWVQVSRIILDRSSLALELSDGAFEKLPPVADFGRMREVFVSHAVSRKIQVTVLEDVER
jgi:hypothetical protein